MNGDFTRDTFPYAKTKQVRRVLMQQGRVLLDADWNEQVSILLHYLRALVVDLIGPHGGNGFAITALTSPDDDFNIGSGHYYVDGILCEIEPPERTYRYRDQPNHKIDTEVPAGLAYLDVWERHLQDDYFREKALNGPDTAIRAQAVWQVKIEEASDDLDKILDELIPLRQKATKTPDEQQQLEDLYEELQNLLNATRVQVSSATLRARIEPGVTSDDPCILPPTAGYRGNENQLYRVEIHNGDAEGRPTFKWSRDNGSVNFPIRRLSGNLAALDNLGRDDRHTLTSGSWVEVVDDSNALYGKPGVLLQVDAVDFVEMTVTLNVPGGQDVPVYTETDVSRHPLLRRWDYTENEEIVFEADRAIPVSAALNDWVDLENGIQIQFESGGTYRTGDYWLIPARTITGNVEWPTHEGVDRKQVATFQPPHGTKHHYAPLARITVANGNVTAADDLRRIIKPPLLP